MGRRPRQARRPRLRLLGRRELRADPHRHLASPLTSGGFARWGARGRGRWVTIYANRRHVYMEVAGLRFDTSAVADPGGGRKGARWRPAIGRRKGFKVRRPAGL